MVVSTYRFNTVYVKLVGQHYNNPGVPRARGEPVLFVREPENEYDKNAVAVYNLKHGKPNRMIGHVQVLSMMSPRLMYPSWPSNRWRLTVEPPPVPCCRV